MRRYMIALLAGITLASPLMAQERPVRERRDDAADRAQVRPEQRAPDARGDDRGQRGPDRQQDARGQDDRGPGRPDGRQDRDQDARRGDDSRFGPGGRGPESRGPDGRGPDAREFDGRGQPGFGGPGQRGAWDAQRGRDDHAQRPGGYGARGDDRGRDWIRQPDPRRFGANGGGNRGGDWSRGWRDERRYDWQDRRATNGRQYRVGRYVPPRRAAYGYRRWSVGGRIAPTFFARDYWLDDAAGFGLPPAYGPYRWVRYYDDVLLVDVRTGAIADMVPAFFL